MKDTFVENEISSCSTLPMMTETASPLASSSAAPGKGADEQQQRIMPRRRRPRQAIIFGSAVAAVCVVLAISYILRNDTAVSGGDGPTMKFLSSLIPPAPAASRRITSNNAIHVGSTSLRRKLGAATAAAEAEAEAAEADSDHRPQQHEENDTSSYALRSSSTGSIEIYDLLVDNVGRSSNLVQIDANLELRRWRRNMRKFKKKTRGLNYRFKYTRVNNLGISLGQENVLVQNNRANQETLPTMMDLFQQIQQSVKKTSSFLSFDVRYNRKFGFPGQILIQYIDEENGETFTLRVRTGRLRLIQRNDGTGLPPINRQDCSAIPYTSHDVYYTRWLRRSGKPTRTYKMYTPVGYNKNEPAKVVVMLHGWSQGNTCDGEKFLSDEWQRMADRHNYILVGPHGLGEDKAGEFPRSWAVPGSTDGRGRNGRTVTACDDRLWGPDHCYPSCGGCGGTRCGWAQCEDDDVQFFVDLVEDLRKYICMDSRRIYVFGYSNGGMMAWTLAQDKRSAPLIAGIGAVQGLPMHDYLLGKGVERSRKLPVIGIYGERDCSVPPGNGRQEYNEVCDGDGYYYVDAWHQHRLWAEDHGCRVSTFPGYAQYTTRIPGRYEIECSSHCDPSGGPSASVDCRANAAHGKEPWHLDAVLSFFDSHAKADGL